MKRCRIKSIIFILWIIIIVNAQTLNQKIDQKTGQDIPVGIALGNHIQDDRYREWYDREYKNYLPDDDITGAIKDFVGGVMFETYMGTWCEDSRREVPRFYKVLDYVEFPAETMRLVMVDRDKQSGTDAEDGKNIHHVPTFILYKDGMELGRIVETPIESLEDDIFNILIGSPFQPNYHDWVGKDKN